MDGRKFASESGDGVLNTTGFMDKVREETGRKDEDLTGAEGGTVGERWHFHVCIFKVTQWDYKCIQFDMIGTISVDAIATAMGERQAKECTSKIDRPLLLILQG